MNTLEFNVRAAVPRKVGVNIAFGAERLALIPFRAPKATILIALALAILAVLGIHRIRIDDSLSQRSSTSSRSLARFSLERI